MNAIKTRSSRRAFFLQGGAALGAGVASAAGASTLLPGQGPPGDPLQQLQQQLAGLADRDAIQQLNVTYMAKMEHGAYEDVAELFDDKAHLRLSGASAEGKPAIQRLFEDQYRRQNAAALHSAYRRNVLQQADAVTLSEDRLQATATFHVDVLLSTPLQGDSTAAAMARLQGQMADRRWESGRFEATYVKTPARWKMTSLRYLAA